MTLYHVTRGWDGGTLAPLMSRAEWSDELAESIAAKWGCDAWTYYHTEGRYVHCHASLAEAEDYRDEWCPGGVVLAIDASELDVEVGREYPHPVVRDEIPAWLIRPLDDSRV